MDDHTNGDADFGDVSTDFNETAVELSASDLGADESNADGSEDPELEAIRARVKEMEEEAEKLKEMQSEVERTMNLSSSSSTGVLNLSKEEKADADMRSIYIGNVDYSATAEELEAHFHGCGSINRVTILCDRYSGHPKGFAYVEFADKESVSTATALDDSLFKGRQIKVSAKRTNLPGLSSTNRPPRGRGRGRGRGGYGGGGGASYAGGYSQFASGPYSRPYRGRGAWRPRRGYYYSPY